jgi:ribonuclease HII
MPQKIKPKTRDSLFDMPEKPNFQFELDLKTRGIWPVAGLDEAGRGPLAGPVVAAAVILDENNIPEGLNDSKKLSHKKREALFFQILDTATVAICSNCAQTIDQTDIRKASLDAMRRALNALAVTANYALVDGRDIPPKLSIPADALIKGDARSISIAAASIIAKVTRDHMMEQAATTLPEYKFERHAGYGTKIHKQAIKEHGASILHRMTFRPLRKD